MYRKLSKEFYLIVGLVLVIFLLFIFLLPLSRAFDDIFQGDSKVIKNYYSALNRKNYKIAYGLLSNLVLQYKTNDGKSLSFDIKPDYEKFVGDHKKIEKIRILNIKRMDGYCYPEVGLRCFKVEASIKYKDLIVTSGGKTVIYVYTLNTGRKPLILDTRTIP